MIGRIEGFIAESQVLTKFRILFAEKIENFRIVGGVVRNHFIGIGKTDIDIATTLSPMELQEFCAQQKIKFFEIGGAYGTIGVKILGHVVEITSTRIDIKTYGRKADIKFTPDWKEDSKRRDFTINALYVDFEDNLYDFHDGQKDLKNHVLKFIGVASDRIKEDYLRILRAYRFAAELPEFEIDQADKATIERNISHLAELSRERVKSELFRIFKSQSAPFYLNYFKQIGILEVLNLQIKTPPNFVDKWQKAVIRNELILIAISNQDKAYKALQYNFALSNNELCQIKLLTKYASCKISSSDICQFIDEHNMEFVKNILTANYLARDISFDEYVQNLDFASNLHWSKFPISGNDIKDLGVTNGIEIGRILADLRSSWYQSEYKLSREDLISLAMGLLGRQIS